MKIDLTVTLIISTYNSPDFLKLSLESLLFQTTLPAEVIIADDGSTDETYKILLFYKKKFPIPIVHIWQEDEGFQAGKIRNIAIMAATTEYIIQIDGDIIMDKHFIADHIFHRKNNTILQGSRVLITERKTKQLINGKISKLSFFSNGILRRENAIRSKIISTFLSTRYRNSYPIYYARGCNMSFYKKDFIKVNGYNHDFLGWGHEDSELTLRFLNNGCDKHFIKFHCVAYHLYHVERSRELEPQNMKLMNDQVKLNAQKCMNGCDVFLDTFKNHIRI